MQPTKPARLRELQCELATLKRRNGATFRAIAKAVGVSKSTAYRWTEHVEFAQPEARCRAELVPCANGMGYSVECHYDRPRLPDRHKRGGRRRRQHIPDDLHMQLLEADLRRELWRHRQAR